MKKSDIENIIKLYHQRKGNVRKALGWLMTNDSLGAVSYNMYQFLAFLKTFQNEELSEENLEAILARIDSLTNSNNATSKIFNMIKALIGLNRSLLQKQSHFASDTEEFCLDGGCENDRELHSRNIFSENPEYLPNYYRLEAFNKLFNLNGKLKLVKESLTYNVVQVENLKKFDESRADGIYGKIMLPNVRGKRYFIPTLTPNDKIISIRINPLIPFTLSYIPALDMPVIQFGENSSTEQEINVEFILKSSPAPSYNHQEIFKEESFSKKDVLLQQLQEFQFTGNIEVDKKNLSFMDALSDRQKVYIICEFLKDFKYDKTYSNVTSNIDLLNLLIKEKEGVCRHRVFIFICFANLIELSSRFELNDIHAFVEVKIDGHWYPICLGGAALPTFNLEFKKSLTLDAWKSELVISKSEIFSENFPHITFFSQANKNPDEIKQLDDSAYKLLLTSTLSIKKNDKFF